jgi:hypothetical protein
MVNNMQRYVLKWLHCQIQSIFTLSHCSHFRKAGLWSIMSWTTLQMKNIDFVLQTTNLQLWTSHYINYSDEFCSWYCVLTMSAIEISKDFIYFISYIKLKRDEITEINILLHPFPSVQFYYSFAIYAFILCWTLISSLWIFYFLSRWNINYLGKHIL